MQQRPKLQRPATLRDELQFGDKISMDGVKWVNRQGQEYHFYHFMIMAQIVTLLSLPQIGLRLKSDSLQGG
jgi:dissimilatory sulfite reductase (desulfoviridin) alpha/beta subunit